MASNNHSKKKEENGGVAEGLKKLNMIERQVRAGIVVDEPVIKKKTLIDRIQGFMELII